MKKKVLRMARNNLAGRHVQTSGAKVVTTAQKIQMRASQIANDPVATKAFLVRTGMYDNNGKLKQEFR